MVEVVACERSERVCRGFSYFENSYDFWFGVWLVFGEIYENFTRYLHGSRILKSGAGPESLSGSLFLLFLNYISFCESNYS